MENFGYIDVGDEICWWQLEDVGYGFGFGCFDDKHPPSAYISVGHQYWKDFTNVEIPTN